MSIRKWLAALLAVCMLCGMLPAALMESDSGDQGLTIIEDPVEPTPEDPAIPGDDGVQSDAVDSSVEEEGEFSLLMNGSTELPAEVGAPAPAVPTEPVGNPAEPSIVGNAAPSTDFEWGENGLIKKYLGSEANIILPENATAIGDSAFAGKNFITTVRLQDRVTSIGPYAFSGCSSLKDIIIPDSVTSIGAYAFSGCTSLVYNDAASFYLPAKLETLGEYAFSGCSALGGIKIPKTVATIGDYAFSSSTISSLEIEEGVTAIGSHAFESCLLTTVSIPKTVATIGNYAFSQCASLTSLTVADGVTEIGDYAFSGCTGLTTVVLQKSVTRIGNRAFEGCTSLSTLSLAEGLTTIGSYAFTGCASLAQVNLPKGIKTLGDGAFASSGAANVTFGGNIAAMGMNAFENCTSLTSVKLSDDFDAVTNGIFKGCSNLATIDLPMGVTTVGNSAFYDCSSLATVTMRSSVTTIGPDAFHNCTSLTKVDFPKNLAAIDNYAFSGCTNLATVALPASVKSIGAFAFEKCNLSALTLSSGLTSIGEEAFSGSGLTKVVLPDTLTTIGDKTFQNCASLTSVAISDSTTAIGDRAFYGCGNLAAILIPSSVTTFGGSHIFGECASGFKIRCVHDSAAETYAKENHIATDFDVEVFITIEVIPGKEPSKVYDGNNTGSVATSDFKVVFPASVTIPPEDIVKIAKATAEFEKASVGSQKAKVTFELSCTSGTYVYKLKQNVVSVTGGITPKPIAVTPVAEQSKALNEADPEFEYTHEALIGEDKFSGKLSRDPGETVGTYKYTIGTLTAGANYALTLKDGVFTITEKSINAATVTVDAIPAQVYTGKPVEPTVTVRDGGTALTLNTHYKVTYANNTEKGTATATIRGLGVYGGKRTVNFTIGDNTTPISDASIVVSPIPDQYYTGSVITPALTIKHNGTLLKQNTDYNVAYSNNIYEGTATVTITGIGKYSGSRTVTFLILGLIEVYVSKNRSYDAARDMQFIIVLPDDKEAESFKSSKTSVCIVDDDGVVTPLKEGKAKITIKLTNGKKWTLTVKVVDPYKPTKIKLSAESKTIDVYDYLESGETLQIEYELEPVTAETEITWKSSNKKVADVVDGEVIPYKEGSVTIKATTVTGKKTGSIKIKVTDSHAPKKVYFVEGSKGTYSVGDELSLTVVAEGKGGAEAFTTFTWSSSKSSVAEIIDEDDSGATIALLKKGSAKITAKAANGKKATFSVKVTD